MNRYPIYFVLLLAGFISCTGTGNSKGSTSYMDTLIRDKLAKGLYTGPLLILPDNTCGASYSEIINFLCSDPSLSHTPVCFTSYSTAQMLEDSKCLKELGYTVFLDSRIEIIKKGLVSGNSPVIILIKDNRPTDTKEISASNIDSILNTLQ